MATFAALDALADNALPLGGATAGPNSLFPNAKGYNGTSDSDTILTPINWRGPFTIATWVYFSPSASSLAWIGGVGDADITFTRGPSTGDITLDGYTNGATAIRNYSTAKLPDSQWKLLTVTRNAANLVSVYANEELVTSATLSTTTPSTTGGYFVGRREGGTPNWLLGRAAWTAKWGFGLSASEVADLLARPIYTSGASLAVNGDWSVGTWNAQSNGSLTYTVTLNKNGSPVATLQTASATTSGNALATMASNGAGSYTITVAASNSGGNDPAENVTTGAVVYSPSNARRAHHHAAARANQ